MNVFFPTRGKAFSGKVTSKNKKIRIEFPPSASEPNGSEIDVAWPQDRPPRAPATQPTRVAGSSFVFFIDGPRVKDAL